MLPTKILAHILGKVRGTFYSVVPYTEKMIVLANLLKSIFVERIFPL